MYLYTKKHILAFSFFWCLFNKELTILSSFGVFGERIADAWVYTAYSTDPGLPARIRSWPGSLVFDYGNILTFILSSSFDNGFRVCSLNSGKLRFTIIVPKLGPLLLVYVCQNDRTSRKPCKLWSDAASAASDPDVHCLRRHLPRVSTVFNLSFQSAATYVEKELGSLDLLINCAGILHPSGRGETSLKDMSIKVRWSQWGAIVC